MDALLSITWPEAAIIVTATLLAGVIRGYSGFGSALIVVPVVTAIVGPRLAVPAIVVLHLVTAVQLLPGALRDADWERVIPLSVAGSLAVPVGAWVLVSQDPEHLRRAISLLIILFAILMLRGWRYTGRINRWIMAAVGVVGGVITGATTVGGPPVVAFLLAGPHSAAQNRAVIILYFIFIQIVALVMYWIGGLLVTQILWLTLLLSVPLILGGWIGERLFRGASEEGFRRVALLFLLTIGVATLLV